MFKRSNNNVDNNSFFSKFKNDKKYRAKVQLIGYGFVIVLIVIYLNITDATNNYNYSNSTINNNSNDSSKSDINNTGDKSFSFNDLGDNYSYDVIVDVKKKDSNDNDVMYSYNYSGKRYKDVSIINRKIGDNTVTYYKDSDKYYSKEGDQYNEIKGNLIYDILDSNYIEVDGLVKFLNLSSLDHYTIYSSGKREYVYNLKLGDVVLNYKEDNSVLFNVVIENDIVNVSAFFTDIVKLDDDILDKDNILESSVKYKIFDIGKVEEFKLSND